MNIFKGNPAVIVNHTFQVFLVTYLILLLSEQVWPGLVSLYLNLNYLFVLIIILGILSVFSERIEVKEQITRLDDIFIIILGICGFGVIKYKTASLGWLSWVIALIAGILIILLSWMVLDDE